MSPASRASLEARLREQGLEPAARPNLPGEGFEEHAHAYDEFVVERSITVGMPGYNVGHQAKGRSYR